MATKKWAPDTKAAAVARVDAGESQGVVAKDLGISSGMMSNWVSAAKGKKPKPNKMKRQAKVLRRTFSDKFRAQAVKLANKGKTYGQISKQIGVVPSVIANWHKKSKSNGAEERKPAQAVNIKDALYFLKRAEKAVNARAAGGGESPFRDPVAMNAMQALLALEGRL